MVYETLLILDEIGVPLYSARGLTQTLTPIESATNVRRTINGALDDLSYSQFRRYASRISCSDVRQPAIDGVWPGQIVTVHCVAELAYPVSGTPSRTPVSGSEYTEGGFVRYRPVLTMMIKSIPSNQLAEYSATSQWEFELEEVGE